MKVPSFLYYETKTIGMYGGVRGGLIAPYSIKKYIFLFMLKYVFKTKCKFCNQFVSFSTTF